jgi:hypothetical protein
VTTRTTDHRKMQLARLQHMGRVNSFETNVYFYLKVLHSALPDHLCGHRSTELDRAVEHVERELMKLESEDGEEESRRAGGGS